MRHASLTLLLLCLSNTIALAGSLMISGVITQSVPDGTGPAVSNSSLNNISDLQPYTLTLNTLNAINGAGLYKLTGSSLSFAVPAAGASETNFAAITLSITVNGGFADWSLLACITGADCSTGNALSASFRIPAASINALNVAATGLDQPHPFELLEDDGITDIHGSITTYSGTPQVATPEPSSASLAALSFCGMVAVISFRKIHSQNH